MKSLINLSKNIVKRSLAVIGRQIVTLRDPYIDLFRIFRKCPPNGIIDGGAYHGDIALKLVQLFPTALIYAFEPDYTSFPILSKNVAMYSQIRPINLALSSHSGQSTLYMTSYGQTSGLRPPGNDGKRFFPDRMQVVGQHSVSTVALDEWSKQNNIKQIDLIKLDLEGHELETLHGAQEILSMSLALYTEIRFVETHNDCCLFHDVSDYLIRQDYYLYNIYNLASDDNSGLLLWGDAIFINRRRYVNG